MLPQTTDVLIVGAGPTGLVLAASLAQSGCDFVLVDQQETGANTSRAAVHFPIVPKLKRLIATDRGFAKAWKTGR